MLSKDRRDEWEWDYKEQKWYHIECDVYADGHKCSICQIEVPDSFTWADVMEHIKEKEYDQDEYFNLSFILGASLKWDDEGLAAREKFRQSQVFDDREIWSVAVYCVVGGSEGWYVHVDQILSQSKSESWQPMDCRHCGESNNHTHNGDEFKAVFHGRNRLIGKFWDLERAMEVTAALTKYIWSQH